jgi:hypothetical protein
VATTHDGLLRGHGLPSLGQAAALVVLSAVIGARATAPTPGARRARPATPGSQPHLLRLPADPCAAHAARGGVQSQTGVAGAAAAGVALDQSETHHPVWAATRRAGASLRTQPALGVSHDQYPSVGGTEGPRSHHDRLRGPHGVGAAVCHAHDGRRSRRDATGGCVAPVWGSADPRTRHRIPQRQWPGVPLASVPAVRASQGTHPVPHPPAESGGKRFGGGVLGPLHAGRCLSGVSRDGGSRRASTPGVDRTLRSPRPAQRLGDAGASRVLCGVVSQKQDSPCPQLGGAVQNNQKVKESELARKRPKQRIPENEFTKTSFAIWIGRPVDDFLDHVEHNFRKYIAHLIVDESLNWVPDPGTTRHANQTDLINSMLFSIIRQLMADEWTFMQANKIE